jgi:hypothetical protein
MDAGILRRGIAGSVRPDARLRVDLPFHEYYPWLLLTLLIEVPIVLVVLQPRCGVWRSLLAGVLATGISHPLFWFAWSRVVPWVERYKLYVATGEVLVVLVETVVILGVALGFARRHLLLAFGTSLLANAVSFGIGELAKRLM